MSKTKPWRKDLYSPCYSCICETCVYNAATGEHWSWMYRYGTDEVPAEDDFCYRCEDLCIEYDGAPDKHKGVLMTCSKYRKANWYTKQEAEAVALIAEEEAAQKRKAFHVLPNVQKEGKENAKTCKKV